MKNIKNTVAAMSLMAVLGLGAVTANAGLLVSDRGIGTTPTCEATGGIFNQLAGILIVGAGSSVTGILMSGDRAGLLVSDRNVGGCQATQSRDGILMSGD